MRIIDCALSVIYPYICHIPMGHFPQDGENEQNLSDFFFEASL